MTAMSQNQTGDSIVLGQQDLHLFNEGTHYRLWEKMGCHLTQEDGQAGARFAVWAPDAESVSVMGDFNGWNQDAFHLGAVGSSGVWQGFVPGVKQGEAYKYHVRSRYLGYRVDKGDPFAVHTETPPKTASKVWDLGYEWGDSGWMAQRGERNALQAPWSIYELHLGSWMRGEDNRFLTYGELADKLPSYVKDMGFTHVEFLPVMEHPFYGSWGYQTTGYFAPTSRFGAPQDFMQLIDRLHQEGIGVILDWVPSHFPTDEFGLAYFDGTHLYEHADPRKGFQPDWKSYIFNHGRNEVKSFLISSALFWLEMYHADGLRVDAVASMLYLDYSRDDGQWIPNKYGGNENLEAIGFIRQMNQDLYQAQPHMQTMAEESTSWPMVSRPNYVGGLGFGLKWDMGWMHDTLEYMSHEPIHRSYHHNQLTFRMMYAFHENFVLPLSHDEVVHGKRSLLDKMPGDGWQKFANLRLLLGYMYSQPGKKLLFMGGEFGQGREWNHDQSLEWGLLEHPWHQGVQKWTRDLNHLLKTEPALHQLDFSPEGFQWADCNDSAGSTLSLLRLGPSEADTILVAANFTPVVREDYLVGVPRTGYWRELINSDAPEYGGSGVGNMGGAEAVAKPVHGRPAALSITLPPLGILFFKQ